jgi:DMSO/TMAO reductase YedYZ heme-binding membrane subunit
VLGITELNFKLHKILGVLTFIFALLHGTLVLYRMLKIKLSQSLFKS